ncbi:MAG: ergothioneine biosynthesis protein EgtB [Rhodospirillales bacterium]|nr:ergothioneine biosynthesis protein EgtB [Rhodospirillales bacterium]
MEQLRKIASEEKPGATRDETLDMFRRIRASSLELTAPLTAEDQCIQSMADTSPTKWHLAHTSWAFETFVLKPFNPGYEEFHPKYNFLFNSYYESVGPRHQRPKRGLLSRPPLEDVHAYRQHVENATEALFSGIDEAAWGEIRPFMELANNHEQQHQELMLTDIKHVFSCNPLHPPYKPQKPAAVGVGPDAGGSAQASWIEFPEGLVEIGHDFDASPGFAYDNEGPRHKVWLNGFRIASRPVSNAEYLKFIIEGGYRRPEFWLSDGWAACQSNGWHAPLYWQQGGDHQEDAASWRVMTLRGLRRLDLGAPVCHVSLFEADAFAKWAGRRLPLEVEWERMASVCPVTGNFADSGNFHPHRADEGTEPAGYATQVFGDVWEWTSSAYAPYPGYRAAAGAMGEYNGKFMSGQMVLRGGSAVTPEGHVRPTYRNFFYPPDRWQFSGIRLAEDI